ncbi:hypothetical protein O181_079076 [Austropuccinia psidii MF-1]|uniref:Uncharacterized protein n=1 Tax=Austropuccinia psidii MF-1 TaxID=1389203 RepID=A0A9Q3FL67_9BASI|nr:hypothetical protein [Austropuccinia psidii MF-1]
MQEHHINSSKETRYWFLSLSVLIPTPGVPLNGTSLAPQSSGCLDRYPTIGEKLSRKERIVPRRLKLTTRPVGAFPNISKVSL